MYENVPKGQRGWFSLLQMCVFLCKSRSEENLTRVLDFCLKVLENWTDPVTRYHILKVLCNVAENTSR